MKKALIATSVASMIDQFNMPNIRLLSDLGYGVTVAANFSECGSITKARAEDLVKRLEEMGVAVVNIPIPRKVSALGGILRSYRKIRKLSRENKYDIVHCHSPIGGARTDVPRPFIPRTASTSTRERLRKIGCFTIL